MDRGVLRVMNIFTVLIITSAEQEGLMILQRNTSSPLTTRLSTLKDVCAYMHVCKSNELIYLSSKKA